MKAPDKIFIAETPNKLIEIWSDEPIESKPYITEHEYIRKDALLEWAKEQASITEKLNGKGAMLKAWNTLIDKLNSM